MGSKISTVSKSPDDPVKIVRGNGSLNLEIVTRQNSTLVVGAGSNTRQEKLKAYKTKDEKHFFSVRNTIMFHEEQSLTKQEL